MTVKMGSVAVNGSHYLKYVVKKQMHQAFVMSFVFSQVSVLNKHPAAAFNCVFRRVLLQLTLS